MDGLKKYVDITLDKPRKLLLDMNAMIEFERATGEPFQDWQLRIGKRSVAKARKQVVTDRERAVKDGNQELIEQLKDIPAPDEEDLKLPDISMVEIRAFLWCLLLHEDEKVTLKEVGSWIRPDNMEHVMKSMIAARDANIPEAPKNKEGEPDPLAASHQS